MIVKSFEIAKINFNKVSKILFYGKNEGLKKEVIQSLITNKDILVYEEKEILENKNLFLENAFSKSLFEDEKFIIINRATDKILNIIILLIEKNIQDIKILINTGSLDKKSKLRSFFEKDKECLCVAFYPDNEKTLSRFTANYFNSKNIPISQENINLIVNSSNGDRETLVNELKKIEYFSKNGKKLTLENISKIINLAEDHSVSELIDNCLAKNEKKTIKILNENNFSNEDCILITRIFLNKSKKILILSNEFEKNKDMNLTISSAKPPIFWKDKEITKQQIYVWSPQKIKKLIFKINEIELLIKKNVNNSVNIVTDFILEQLKPKTNN